MYLSIKRALLDAKIIYTVISYLKAKYRITFFLIEWMIN